MGTGWPGRWAGSLAEMEPVHHGFNNILNSTYT